MYTEEQGKGEDNLPYKQADEEEKEEEVQVDKREEDEDE